LVDFRFKKLENNVTALHQRVDAHATLHERVETRLDGVERMVAIHEETLAVVKEIAGVAKATYEAIIPIAKALRWVAIAASWCAKIGAGAFIVWQAVKWTLAKAGILL